MKRLLPILGLVPLLLFAAYNGTIIGIPTFVVAKFSNGLSGTGPSDYVAPPSGLLAVLGSTPTYDFWVKASATAGFQNFVVLGTNDYTGMNPSGLLFFAGFGHTSFTVTSALIDDGNSHHIEVTYTGTAVKVFVDGTQVLTDTVSYAAPDGAGGLKLGNTNATSTEWLDELAIWNINRHSSTFTAPTSAYTGSEANIVALYHLDSDANDSVVGGSRFITGSTVHSGNVK